MKAPDYRERNCNMVVAGISIYTINFPVLTCKQVQADQPVASTEEK